VGSSIKGFGFTYVKPIDTFAVGKNPNNALIWPVQFCRANYVV
jgi:hypothetical protein